MGLEIFAILASIYTISTSFIVTKAINFDNKIPSFFYVHLPLYLVGFIYDHTFIIGALVASIYLSVFTIGCAVYVWYNDLW